MNSEIKLVRVFTTEMEALKQYIEALYRDDEDYDSMVYIEEGVKSLLKNELLATAYFIKRAEERIGYVILTKYHSVEKGGLTVFIDELYVETRYRRQGVGKVILDKVSEVARTMGAKTLWAQAESYNTAAQQFFRSQGFQPNDCLNFERPL